MDFGIMFFSSAAEQQRADKYALLLQAARFADEHGFRCIWTPERHFHAFGGLFPNPSVLGAALAMITRRLQIRAGSLISPLHDAIRVAEEWSVVDNLSGGRAAISFGAGWNVDDFIFFPERYEQRQAVMFEQIGQIQRLWRGDPIFRKNTYGKDVEVWLFPRPIQARLPVWITSSGNAETFTRAGAAGANVLTHLIGQDIDALEGKIRSYRAARESAGEDPRGGTVSLMLHSFLGTSMDQVRAKVRGPFRDYLRAAVSLEQKAVAGGGAISGGHRIEPHGISTRTLEELLDVSFERYFQAGSLMGTPASCAPLVSKLEDIGVDEIACLIDFGVEDAAVLEGLVHLDALRARSTTEERDRAAQQAVSAFMEDLDG